MPIAYRVCPTTFIVKNLKKWEPSITDLGVKQWAVEKLYSHILVFFSNFFLYGWTLIDPSNNLKGGYEGSVIFTYSFKYAYLIINNESPKMSGIFHIRSVSVGLNFQIWPFLLILGTTAHFVRLRASFRLQGGCYSYYV